MSEKSYVSMETKLCIVCGCEYSTGAILVDKRLLPRFNRDTCTGWGMCDTHVKAIQEGFVALVEVDDAKSDKRPDGRIDPDGAWRTGQVILVKREILKRGLTGIDIGDQEVLFVEQGVIEKMIGPEAFAAAKAKDERTTHGTPAPGSNSLN